MWLSSMLPVRLRVTFSCSYDEGAPEPSSSQLLARVITNGWQSDDPQFFIAPSNCDTVYVWPDHQVCQSVQEEMCPLLKASSTQRNKKSHLTFTRPRDETRKQLELHNINDHWSSCVIAYIVDGPFSVLFSRFGFFLRHIRVSGVFPLGLARAKKKTSRPKIIEQQQQIIYDRWGRVRCAMMMTRYTHCDDYSVVSRCG